MIKVQEKGYAKINLYLDIIGKRNDGYHFVKMVMQSLDLFDTIEVIINNNNNINIISKYDFGISVFDNSMYKAAKIFFAEINIKNPGIDIKIEKKIPMAAGLAGGSADAAAVLIALNKLFETNLSLSYIAKISEQIGADVPFCVYKGTMIAKGIGTKLEKIDSLPSCYVLLVKPNISVSTKEAYKKSDRVPTSDNSNLDKILSGLKNKNLQEISSNLYNKFENIINIDLVKKIKNTMINNGALGSCMSGSGPTVFGIFDNYNKAINCKNILKDLHKEVYLCRPKNL